MLLFDQKTIVDRQSSLVRRRATVLFLICAAVGAGMLSAQQAARSDAVPLRGDVADVVCGPRCARFLLQWYKKDDPGLVRLIREVQWPNLDEGASLASLDAALRLRGIHTCAIRVAPKAILKWPHPMIVHLADEASRTGGHYVVQLPSSTSDVVHAWVGLPGVQSGPAELLNSRRSGAVLLTSTEPITHPDLAVARSHYEWAFRLFVLGSALFAVAAAKQYFPRLRSRLRLVLGAP